MNEKLFPVLENYLQELHAGRAPNKNRLSAEHPEIAALLNCLDDLHHLATPPESGTEEIRPLDEQTTIDSPRAARTPSDPSLFITDFEQFEILCELGRGGMGVVYKARQKDLDRVVAVKMILSGQFSSEDQVRRFTVEARAAARVQHPNIVRIHATGTLHGQNYLVMEYVEGQSLADLLKRGPPKAEDAASILQAVADAVEHLHQHGIVHRDLKPSNILLDASGQPYVTDFGLAKLLGGDSHQTTTGVIVGTPSYMSPEQAAGRQKYVTAKSDVYSLGAILYELLTGRPPFEEASPLDTLVQVIEGEPAPPGQLRPRVPAELEAICLRCIEKDPDERYPSAAALARDLARFLAGDEVEAQQPSVWQRCRSWARREPALLIRTATLILFAIIVQVNYMILKHEPPAVHWSVMVGLGAWVGVSWLFQRCLRNDWQPEIIRFAWAAVDIVFLTMLLIVTRNQAGPLNVGYPLLVAASGLWFRVSLVWFTTSVAVIAYLVLVYAPFPRMPIDWLPHQHILFVIALFVVGFVVAYQVKRVRALSRYYGQRPLP